MVYVNGREIARSHLPGGPIEDGTPADDYANESYTSIENRPIGYDRMTRAALADRLELRIRHLRDLHIPGAALRAGVNVLAIELHRSVVRNLPKSYNTDWSTVGFIGVQLKSYPSGFLLWNANPLRPIGERDYGDSFSSLEAITLVAPRNGVCSGQVIASSYENIKGLKATCRDFEARESSATISSNQITIRYAGYPARLPRSARKLEAEPYFDVLLESPPPESTVQPIWLTVRVPENAAAGEYAGSLTVDAATGQTASVPILLKVCDWTVPAPSNFTAHVGLIQSPDSVALKYRVPLWSKAHFQLLEKSFEIIGEVGNKFIVLPLIAQTHFGNEESIVRWIRQAEGSFKPDFEVLDRYLDLCQKYMSTAAVVCLYVWEPFMGGDEPPGFNYDSAINLQFRTNGIPITCWDPVTHQTSPFNGPSYGTPEGRHFWQPVLDGVRERLKNRGWDDTRIMLGIIADRWPSTEAVRFFKDIAPYANWAMHCHPISSTNIHGAIVRHAATAIAEPINCLDTTPLHTRSRARGWSLDWEKTVFPRGPISYLKRPCLPSLYAHPAAYHNVIEASLTAGYRGVARLGLDFWDLPDAIENSGQDPFRRGLNVAGRYPQSSWGSLSLSACVHHLVAPGPNGAIPTVRFEMFREGLQESEARIFIEKIISDDALRARLPSELVERSEKVLDERLNAWLIGSMCWDWFASSEWQERTKRLFDTAGEISATVHGQQNTGRGAALQGKQTAILSISSADK